MLSVIIPTCNRVELLKKCIEHLHYSKQSLSPELYEVIVTDDSYDTATKDFVQHNFKWVTWVKGPKRGPAANRNNGAKHVKGDWLIFIDDDCLPNEQLINEYLKKITENSVYLAFEGAILPDSWKSLRKDMAECPINTVGGCFWSANICVQKKLFESIGGFNEQFIIAAQEDQELYLRIQSYTPVLFCKNCVVVHPVRYKTLKQKINHIPVEIKNWLLFARIKHTWIRVFFDGVVSQLKACGRTIRRSQFKMVIYHFATLVYLIPGILLFIFQNNGKQKV